MGKISKALFAFSFQSIGKFDASSAKKYITVLFQMFNLITLLTQRKYVRRWASISWVVFFHLGVFLFSFPWVSSSPCLPPLLESSIEQQRKQCSNATDKMDNSFVSNYFLPYSSIQPGLSRPLILRQMPHQSPNLKEIAQSIGTQI